MKHIVVSLMNIDTSHKDQPTPKPSLAVQYKISHQQRLMLLTRLQGEFPTRSEFCRIKAVDTLAPDLWVTVGFLDGSTKGMRPDKLRVATKDEERLAEGLLDPRAV